MPKRGNRRKASNDSTKNGKRLRNNVKYLKKRVKAGEITNTIRNIPQEKEREARCNFDTERKITILRTVGDTTKQKTPILRPLPEKKRKKENYVVISIMFVNTPRSHRKNLL